MKIFEDIKIGDKVYVLYKDCPAIHTVTKVCKKYFIADYNKFDFNGVLVSETSTGVCAQALTDKLEQEYKEYRQASKIFNFASHYGNSKPFTYNELLCLYRHYTNCTE